MQSGCWQCEVEPEDQNNAAFSIGLVSYEFNVLPFEVCNRAATFQRLMDVILDGLHWHTAMVYLVDVIVVGKNFDEHYLTLVLKFVNPIKCNLAAREMEFLRHVVNQHGIYRDSSKLRIVNDWPISKNITEL